MARTALDLTTEELYSYKPGSYTQGRQIGHERREHAWKLARSAANLLRERFAATQVVIFGALAHQHWFGPGSDIDLAVWGITASQFYRAVATVMDINQDFQVDLVDPENCHPTIRQALETEGIEI